MVTRSRGGGLGRFLGIIVENQSGRVRVRAWRSRINIYLERERERERGKAESILPASERKKEGKKERRKDERGGPWIYIPVNHFEPSAARLKFSRGRADVIKTNYAYGTVIPHHFVP